MLVLVREVLPHSQRGCVMSTVCVYTYGLQFWTGTVRAMNGTCYVVVTS